MLLVSTAASSRSLEEFERQIARTPPVSTDFVEYRFSRLLKKPLRVGGMLEYRADGVLARKVESPYQELTEVMGEQVQITRAGKPPRTVLLQRAPQLRAVLGSLRALLEGKLQPLAVDFDIVLEDSSAGWKLTLTPKDARLKKYLMHIDVFGAGDRPACLQTVEPDGDASLTLFGSPPASPSSKLPPARAELESRCRSSVGPAAAGP
jgi:Outer membrane lipoprotein carrier protein LolA-like